MASLAEHIAAIEAEIYLMTKDGHHQDATVRAAMERLDTGVRLLHQANRQQAAEGGDGKKRKNN